jgi:SAM-dependent methyltransferase
MTNEPVTWHRGLMARWWAEFNRAEPDELAYYRGTILRSGEPALDLACGAGRLLLPLIEAGLDVDGVDASPDMLAQARRLADERGLAPSLIRQPVWGLDLPRRYSTIFMCDSFGIGGSRQDDLEGLRRIHSHLEPGGTFVFSHDVPYGDPEEEWLRWLPGRVGEQPKPWPAEGDRRRAADGDEIELSFRERSWDPFTQRSTMDVRARLWRGQSMIREEEHAIALAAYFVQEIALMLEVAGFVDVEVEGRYTGKAATADDTTIVFVARRPAG